MSYGSSADIKEQVRQAIDIVDLVGSYAQLRRQGRNYVALCPWHDDSRPSLQVNPERQSFKCWVCDIGGDVFSFLMKMEGVDFREALAMLADRAGISLEKPHRERSPDGAQSEHDKRTLLQAAAWAERQYHEFLLSAPEAEPARRYLQDRGLTAESIEQFHLGFSPLERDWILKRAGGSGSRGRILEKIGILIRPEGGGLFDRFRGRVLFSIRDTQGRPVGLGGRVLPELGTTSPAKYVNSPETPLFTKSHLLYGLDVAREAIRKTRTALVMEGYTDVIVAHQYGFTNAVAVLGTALGESHVRILKRFADRIVLVLDGDEAGQKRANEVLELFVAQQVDLDVLTLPDDLDPCDFLHQRGAEAFGQLLAGGAVDALDHAFQTATRGIDLERDVHGASQALERLVAILAKAPRYRDDTTRQHRLREQMFLERFAKLFRVPEAEVRQRVTELRRGRKAPAASMIEPPPAEQPWRLPPGDSFETELMELLLVHPAQWAAAHARIGAAQLAGHPCRAIYETGCRLLESGETPTFERLMLEFEESGPKSLLVELDERGRAKANKNPAADPEALLEQLLHTLLGKEVEKQRPAISTALNQQGLDTSQEIDLLKNIIQQERSRQGISKPMDG